MDKGPEIIDLENKTTDMLCCFYDYDCHLHALVEQAANGDEKSLRKLSEEINKLCGNDPDRIYEVLSEGKNWFSGCYENGFEDDVAFVREEYSPGTADWMVTHMQDTIEECKRVAGLIAESYDRGVEVLLEREHVKKLSKDLAKELKEGFDNLEKSGGQ